ncbi:MAG: amidohydrolase family protein [Algibacter sp.]
MTKHNHECKIGCGCYHPAIDLLIKDLKVRKPKQVTPLQEEDQLLPNNIFVDAKIYPMEIWGEDHVPESYSDFFNAMLVKENSVRWIGKINYTEDMTEEQIKIEILLSSGISQHTISNSNINRLGQKTILPGLIEPHCHIVPSSIIMKTTFKNSENKNQEFFNDYSPFTGDFLKLEYNKHDIRQLISENLEKIKNYNKTQNKSFWLLGYGIDPSMIWDVYPNPDNHGDITIENCFDSDFFDYLQDECEAIPILIISASMHTAYLNTPAIDATCIYMENDNKYSEKDIASVRKSRGVLNELTQMEPALMAINEQQLKEIQGGECVNDAIDSYMKSAREKGITMLYDAGMKYNFKEDEGWADLFLDKNHDMRIGMSFLYDIFSDKETAGDQLDRFFEANNEFEKPNEENINAYWASVKIVSDGSNQGLTGYQSHNYVCPPCENGIDNFKDQAEMDGENNPDKNRKELINKILLHDWPVIIHANGDEIVNKTIEAYEASIEGVSNDKFLDKKLSLEKFKTLRNRIEHCSLLNEKGVKSMGELEILPSFLIGHVGYWGDVFNGYIFPDGTNGTEVSVNNKASTHLDLCQSTLSADLKISLHSDNNVSPLGPLRYAEQAITRVLEASPKAKEYYDKWHAKDENLEKAFDELKISSVLNKKECLTTYQALRAVTIDAAYQCHADKLVGSLLIGKLADFVVLEKNPMEMDEPYKAYLNMRSIQVVETWIGGNKVHSLEEKLIPNIIKSTFNAI